MKSLNKLTKEELVNLLITTAEDAFYNHDTGSQEEAKEDLVLVKEEVLRRMG